jgi:hypothetical protein
MLWAANREANVSSRLCMARQSPGRENRSSALSPSWSMTRPEIPQYLWIAELMRARTAEAPAAVCLPLRVPAPIL